MTRKRPSPNVLTDESGVITVEFVIGVPVILAAMLFSFEFGRALWAYDVMSSDMQDALRYLTRAHVVDFSNASDPAIQAAEALAMTGSPSSSVATDKRPPWNWSASSLVTVTTTNYSSSDYSVNGVQNGATQGTVATMTGQVPITLSFLGFLGINTHYTLTVTDHAVWIGE